jgi:hypothetical protein
MQPLPKWPTWVPLGVRPTAVVALSRFEPWLHTALHPGPTWHQGWALDMGGNTAGRSMGGVSTRWEYGQDDVNVVRLEGG